MADKLDTAYQAWRSKPDKQTTAGVIKALAPVIDKALTTYGFQGNANARTMAQLHAASVLPRYDPSKAKLNTFMTNELRRLQRIVPQQTSPLPVPEGAALDLRTLKAHEAELTALRGREPTTAELTDSTGLSEKRIEYIRSRYDIPQVGEQSFVDDEGYTSLPGTLRRDESVWVDAVYDEVDDIDKKILDWSLGRAGAPVLEKTEMARRLGITPAAVTQRSIRLANKLQEGTAYEGVV